MTCICKYCPAEGSDKCPKKRLEFDANYQRDLRIKAESKEREHG